MAERVLEGIVLAAGKGTRMRSDLPKGLHRILGVPMVELAARNLRKAGVTRPTIVVGHGGDQIVEALGDGYAYAWQREQLGTGHAALCAETALKDHDGPVLIVPGDAPLIEPDFLRRLAAVQAETGAACAMATCVMDDPFGYGRILRDAEGRPMGIVEEKDATPEQKALREVCVSVYCFQARTLFRLLKTLRNDNAQGEYYLTDMVGAIYRDGGNTVCVRVQDTEMLMGVNDRWQLAEAARVLRTRILRAHALAGVTIVDPGSTHVGPDVEIGADSTLLPNTVLEGRTVVGAGCAIGPNTVLRNATVEDGASVVCSFVADSTVGAGSRVGPFAHLRGGTRLGSGARVGNFVEMKNVEFGASSSAAHLTYLGDASVGESVNVGAGTITCNYDGFTKHRTRIGDGAFVGSNSTLIAPVTIGEGSVVGAGSVIRHDVPKDALAIARADQVLKEGWAARRREAKGGKK
ncbi:MAG: bifunctional UDP-N-acetylglucosamine diphosphorylase/glucosamine-1-phosphate N-acetyltransferase GlmU [Fimbriimonadales bacterium]|nr:bifunctional UDP-N-acetylglucosamine diphosphorylase/glucosamine-1-phosphate N-acetyltransferase GlmU [Fimbriimonadales bacterium]